MFHKFRFVIAGVLFLVASVVLNQAVSAYMPNALLPAGTTRYAAASAVSSFTIHDYDAWTDVPGMIKYITIPTGKTADVIVLFCGMQGQNATGTLLARALIRDSLAVPADAMMVNSTTSFSSSCAIFQKSNVTAGSPAVKVQLHSTGGSGTMYTRQMLVIVNSH